VEYPLLAPSSAAQQKPGGSFLPLGLTVGAETFLERLSPNRDPRAVFTKRYDLPLTSQCLLKH